jgi:hypothetical protein
MESGTSLIILFGLDYTMMEQGMDDQEFRGLNSKNRNEMNIFLKRQAFNR